MRQFRWLVGWKCVGDSGTYASRAYTLKGAIAECKAEMRGDKYGGRVIRPDICITDCWKFVQYGEVCEECSKKN